MFNGDRLKGILGAVLIPLLASILIASIPLSLLYAKVHMIGVVTNYVSINKARLALISILSKTKNGKSYADMIVEKIVKKENLDDLRIGNLLEKMGFDCYKMYIDEDNVVITEKRCENKRTVETRVMVPLPDLNYKTIVLEVGV